MQPLSSSGSSPSLKERVQTAAFERKLAKVEQEAAVLSNAIDRVQGLVNFTKERLGETIEGLANMSLKDIARSHYMSFHDRNHELTCMQNFDENTGFVSVKIFNLQDPLKCQIFAELRHRVEDEHISIDELLDEDDWVVLKDFYHEWPLSDEERHYKLSESVPHVQAMQKTITDLCEYLKSEGLIVKPYNHLYIGSDKSKYQPAYPTSIWVEVPYQWLQTPELG